MANIVVDISDCSSDEKESLTNGGGPLLDLCQKEVDSFDQYLKQWGSSYPEGSMERDFADGLAQWERTVVAGYLYQKALGRF